MVNNETKNKQISNDVIDNLKLNPMTDAMPLQVIPNIQPVYDVLQRNCDIVRSQNIASSGSSTIYTTPTNQDFYLCSATFSFAKDATCDVATGPLQLNAVISASTRGIIQHAVLTLTAQNGVATKIFNPPIKIDRNTALTLSGTFTAGAMARTGEIAGFLVTPGA